MKQKTQDRLIWAGIALASAIIVIWLMKLPTMKPTLPLDSATHELGYEKK